MTANLLQHISGKNIVGKQNQTKSSDTKVSLWSDFTSNQFPVMKDYGRKTMAI